MRRPTAIDVHTHFYPERYLDLIAAEGSASGLGVSRTEAGPILTVDSMRIGPLRRSFFDLDVRRREMDRLGVRVHALSLTFPMVYWAPPDLGLRLARAFNDAAAEAHAAFPERFVGLAILPMQEPALAVAELDRVARLPGIRGVYAGTGIAGRELSAPEFFPLYERLEQLRWPLFLHPVDLIATPRLHPYYLGNLVGHPFDTTVAAAYLIFGGVLDRFRRLQVCLPHAGGALPWVIGRLDRGWKVRGECRQPARKPSAYLRRFLYDTISHSPQALGFLIRAVGADRVVLGSDYCFTMGYDRPLDVLARLRPLAGRDRARILSDNAARLLRLRP
jgi:aminocarboxymuconate-semialdehyde decarboxylase